MHIKVWEAPLYTLYQQKKKQRKPDSKALKNWLTFLFGRNACVA